MTANYNPDPSILNPDPSQTALLSQRDASLSVPINLVTHPGVSLTAACFGEKQYLANETERCFSNLLALRIRRLHIDLFWDDRLQDWTLCPVKYPSTGSLNSTGSTNTTAASQSAGTSITPANASTVIHNGGTGLVSASEQLHRRAANSIVSNGGIHGNGSYTAGLITCSPSINIPFLNSILDGYGKQTATTLDARLGIVVLNLAVASNSSDTEVRPSTPAVLPSADNGKFLSDLFTSNLSAVLYTPAELKLERANLNSSWYTVAEAFRPADAYLNISSGPMGILSTDDGWPNEGYIELTNNRRLLIGYGTISPEISAYNTTRDNQVIFKPGELTNNKAVIQSSLLGNDPSCRGEGMDRPTGDVSWAINEVDSSSTALLALQYCGYSPFLNVSIPSSASPSTLSVLTNFSESALWSWAPDQPANASASATNAASNRCATVSMSDPHSRWTASDCNNQGYAACLRNGTVDGWTITTNAAEYRYGPQSCPSNTTFAVPRTALEQAFLHRAISNAPASLNLGTGNGKYSVFVNINSLNTPGCWVTSGPNGLCPYSPTDQTQRTVLVPTIAALIVLVLTLLMLVAKCNQNRRGSKRRKRRMKGEWEYEGVPS